MIKIAIPTPKGQVFQVKEWRSPEEDIIYLDLEGRENNAKHNGELSVTKIRLLFNLLHASSRQQLETIFDDQRIQAPSLQGRLNLLKDCWLEIKQIQGILQE